MTTDDRRPAPDRACDASGEPNEPASHPGVVPGSIGDLSIRLGQDVRELMIDGADLAEIYRRIDERERRLGATGGADDAAGDPTDGSDAPDGRPS